MSQRTIYIGIAVIILVAAAGLGGLQIGVFDQSLTPAPGTTVDFKTLERAPISYLVAPDGFTPGPSDGEAPVLGVSVEKLKQNWEAVMARQQDVVKIGESADGLQMDYVRWGTFPRVPELIAVRFIPMPSDPETGDYATIAVYSRAPYGSSDVAEQKERITKWLYAL